MSVAFGSQEWLDLFVERINQDEEFKRVASDFEDRLILNCKAAPEIHESLKEDLRVYVEPHEGEVREARLLKPGEDPDKEHEIEGEYVNWKKIFKGELDVKRAVVISRKLKVHGKVTRLLKHLKATERILKVLNEMIDEGIYQFPDEIVE